MFHDKRYEDQFYVIRFYFILYFYLWLNKCTMWQKTHKHKEGTQPPKYLRMNRGPARTTNSPFTSTPCPKHFHLRSYSIKVANLPTAAIRATLVKAKDSIPQDAKAGMLYIYIHFHAKYLTSNGLYKLVKLSEAE